jgi:hypothetical protein
MATPHIALKVTVSQFSVPGWYIHYSSANFEQVKHYNESNFRQMRLRPKFMTTDPLDLLMYSIEGCCLYSTNKTFKKIQSSLSFSLFATTFISKLCIDIKLQQEG